MFLFFFFLSFLSFRHVQQRRGDVLRIFFEKNARLFFQFNILSYFFVDFLKVRKSKLLMFVTWDYYFLNVLGIDYRSSCNWWSHRDEIFPILIYIKVAMNFLSNLFFSFFRNDFETLPRSKRTYAKTVRKNKVKPADAS